jgi:hypothetical protein
VNALASPATDILTVERLQRVWTALDQLRAAVERTGCRWPTLAEELDWRARDREAGRLHGPPPSPGPRG